MIKLEITERERSMLLNLTRNACILCRQTGYNLGKDGKGDPVFEDCKCVKNFARYAAYVRAGVHRRYWEWVPDDDTLDETFKSKNTQGIADLIAFGNDMDSFVRDGKTLYIWGGYGTGKTAFSLWLLKQALAVQTKADVIDFKYKCGLMTLRELVQLLVDCQIDPEQKPLLEYVQQLDMLVIDEFDKEHNTGTKERFSGVAFGDIFNLFYNQRKAMIVLSNSKVVNLKEDGIHTLDVLDRLAEFDQTIELHGSSYRQIVKHRTPVDGESNPA